MNYKDILRNKPWLKFYDTGKISSRLLKATHGNAFICFNIIQAEFQLHTVQAEEMSGDSTNANIPIDVLNQWIIEDYNSNDFEKYVDDIVSEHQLYDKVREEKNSDKYRELQLAQQLQTVERVMGTKV